MSRISSFKRDWDGEPPSTATTTATSVSQTTRTTITPASSQGTTGGAAPRAKGSRLATIMAALQSSGDNKATGKMTPPPPPSFSSASPTDSTASWVNSVATSMTSSASSSATKRSRDEDDDEDEGSKKRRSSREGVQMNLTVAEKAVARVGTAPPPPPGAKMVITLSYEQSQILELVKQGKNVFFTGSAGTGKSVLLREVIKLLKKKHGKAQDSVAVTASTGIAACNIGGQTLHSFSGIGIGEGTPENLAVKIKKNKNAVSRWLRCKVLIIDEVSMLDGDLFDRLARVACILKKNTRPFGGIQLIVTGDFFQLPPVMKGGQPKFAFEAEKWSECVERTFNLGKVFRQKDQRFVDMLNDMRFGRLTQASIRTFLELARPIPDDGIDATELFPRREDVDRANNQRMSALPGREEHFPARDAGAITDAVQRDKMLQNFMAPKELTLKKNAQVMLLKNIDETLVNGSVGRVVEFYDATEVDVGEKGELIQIYAPEDKKKLSSATKAKHKEQRAEGLKKYPLVEFRVPRGTRKILVMPESFKVELPNGEVQVSRTQLPLILSWAMSIHKSQGQTLDRVKVDCGRIFEKGQAYVALSRATSLEGLQVLNFDPKKVQAHDKVKVWSQTLECITQQNE